MIDLSSLTSILVTGSIAYDEIMNFPGHFKDHFHPEKLHQINVSFVVSALDKHVGGTATNIAYNVSRITDKKVSVLGAMGKDHGFLTDFFDTFGIDYSGSLIDQTLFTSTGKVMTDNDNNQIWGYYYGAGAKGNQIDFMPYKKNAFAIISANHANAFYHAQEFCIEHGVPYLYDPGMVLTFIDDMSLRKGIEHAEFVVGNDYEVAQMERRLGKKLIHLVRDNAGVITTLSAEGAQYEDQNKKCHVAGYQVKQVVDPTGAGDAWRGGFVGALFEGLSLEDAMKTANALASFAVEQSGTANHTPSREEVEVRAEKLDVR